MIQTLPHHAIIGPTSLEVAGPRQDGALRRLRLRPGWPINLPIKVAWIQREHGKYEFDAKRPHARQSGKTWLSPEGDGEMETVEALVPICRGPKAQFHRF